MQWVENLTTPKFASDYTLFFTVQVILAILKTVTNNLNAYNQSKNLKHIKESVFHFSVFNFDLQKKVFSAGKQICLTNLCKFCRFQPSVERHCASMM